MSDMNVRSESVDVEQIMKQIRARVREKRGADYTEAETMRRPPIWTARRHTENVTPSSSSSLLRLPNLRASRTSTSPLVDPRSGG